MQEASTCKATLADACTMMQANALVMLNYAAMRLHCRHVEALALLAMIT